MFPKLKRAALARAIVLSGVGFAALSLCGCVYRERVVYASPPPPPPPPGYYYAPAPPQADAPPPQDQVEVVGVAPGPDYIWIGGYWVWHGDHYDWIHGRWGHRPWGGAVWVGGHWQHGSGGWFYARGYWR
ncbi:MAG: hypothetical protein ABSF29_03160 [Tepidisphaeraceae bacterium]|jgi:hypothetical protein